jgi:hypothetical protein
MREWRDEDGRVVLAGFCDSCGFASVYCQECEAVTLFIDGDDVQCDGCPAVYRQELDRKGLLEMFLRLS